MFMPLVTLTVERRSRFERVFRGALAAANLTLDQGSREAEKDVSQFKRILAGVERHLDPLTKQDDTFWQALGEHIVLEFGISRRARLAAKLRAFTIGTKRQLRINARKAARTA